MKKIFGTIILFLLFFLLFAGCLGPKPEVTDIKVKRDEKAGVYDVDVTIRNRNSGDGEVGVIARLVDKKTGKIFEEQEKLEIKSREIANVHIEVHAPAGDYDHQIEAKYPEM